MFRKPVTIHARSKVSGADRKKLRRALEAAFGGGNGNDGDNDNASSEASQVDRLLPSKHGDLELWRPQGSRVHIYALRGADDDAASPADLLVPILLDVSGHGDLAPTVQGCWRATHLLPRLPLKHYLVSKFVVKGADVMLPGIDTERLPQFAKGDVVAIVCPGNDAPVAVGRALLSSSEARERGASDAGGKAVEIISYYGDHLWRDHGGATVPNKGFREDVVAPEDDGGAEEEDGAAAAAGDGSAAAAGAAAAATAAIAAVGLGSGKEGGATQKEEAAAAAPPPAADMDALVEASLLQALSTTVKDTALPMRGEALWKDHVLPARPAGVAALDVKKSKHKRVPKALQHYSKQGLLSVKEDRASGDVIVTRVVRTHALLAAFVPHATSSSQEGGGGGGAAEQQHGGASGGGGGGGGGTGGGGLLLGGGGPLTIEETFVPGKELKPVLEAVGALPDGGSGMSAQAVSRAVEAYAAKLASADGGRAVVLDATLCDALLKGVLKKGELYPETLPKAGLAAAALARCQQQTVVSRGGASSSSVLVKKGAAPVLLVTSEKRQGTRRITKIHGLEQFLISAEAVGEAAAKKFASAATLEDALGKHNKAKIVCVQGDVVDAAVAWLCDAPFGVPKKHIEVKKCKA
jgi:translation initiation factor 2D